MKWYVIFFLGSIPSLALSIYEIRKQNPSKKKIYYFLLISGLIGITINLIYTPIDHYDSEIQNQRIIQKNLELSKSLGLHEKSITSLTRENILLTQKNNLLEKNIGLVDKNLKKFKNQIVQLAITYEVFFQIDSLTDISSEQFLNYESPVFAFLQSKDLKKREIYFQSTSRIEYYKSIPNETFRVYSLKISSEVKDIKFPIGQKLKELDDYDKITLNIRGYSIPPNSPVGVKIYSCSVIFTINGFNFEKNRINCPSQNTMYGHTNFSYYSNDPKWFQARIKLNKSIYEYLNLANI